MEITDTKNHVVKKPKKDMPLGWRLSFHVAAMATLLCITVVLSLLPFQYGRVEREAITEARILAEAVSTIYKRLGDSEPRDHARRLLLRVARTPHISLVNVHDRFGMVRYSTDSRELGKQVRVRYGVLREENELTITHVVSDEESAIGSVSVVLDKEIMLQDTHRLFAQVGIGLCAMILLLCFIVKGLVERLVTARLMNLMHSVENAEQGSFLIRAEVDRHDEIGHVIRGFNQLMGVITQIEARHLEKEHSHKDAEVQKGMREKLEDALFNLERSNERLMGKIKAQDLLMDSAHRLGGTLKREAVVERLLELVKEKLTWPRFAVFLNDTKKNSIGNLQCAASFGFKDEELPKNQRVSIGDGIVGMVAQTGAPIVIKNVALEKRLNLWTVNSKPFSPPMIAPKGSLVSLPMIHKGRVIGVFVIFQNENNAFEQEEITLISALGAQTALATVNAELYEATLELATFDPLTGVLNRRSMVKQIEDEVARAQRFDTSFALLLVDVDHFKSYNDRMGHVLGDVALKEIAKALQASIRKVDSLARFGGEEFSVILPQSNLEAAKEVANKLCGAVRALKLRGVEKQELGHLSVSIGIAIVPKDIDELDSKNVVTDIIAVADQALYEAKRLGRDRFIASLK